MTDGPVDLDAYRGIASLKAAETRRQHLYELQCGSDVLRIREEELERILTSPAASWPEAAIKAQYLIRLFSATAEAQDSPRKELIAQTLDDLSRLCEREKETR